MRTVFQENVEAFATRDVEAAADMVLGVAVAEARAWLAERRGTESYRVARVELWLADALSSARRIRGERVSS